MVKAKRGLFPMTNDFQIYIESKFSSLPVPSFHPRLPKGPRGSTDDSKQRAKIPVLFQARDFQDALWDVTMVRATKHGFDLLLGYRAEGPFWFGPPRVICTSELKDFWERNRAKTGGLTYDLPAGRTTLKRVRRRLGFHFRKDVSKFWMDRLADLKTMRARDFAAKHDCALAVVLDTRRRLVGRVAREIGWWNKPAIVEFLLSGVTRREIAEKLGISLTQASRLRTQAQASRLRGR
jgi:hypothetical protein